MYTVFLAGGIGSGKSTVARQLEQLGCARIDLDQLSRDVLQPGSPILQQVAEAFGHDLIDPETSGLDRQLLAERAFSTSESARLLEGIEIPGIIQLLRERLALLADSPDAPAACVIEVPLLDRALDMLTLADEVVVVTCPYELRRDRAVGRGMKAQDFEARAANQPSDEWLVAHASTVLCNDGTPEHLRDQVLAWWEALGEGDAS